MANVNNINYDKYVQIDKIFTYKEFYYLFQNDLIYQVCRRFYPCDSCNSSCHGTCCGKLKIHHFKYSPKNVTEEKYHNMLYHVQFCMSKIIANDKEFNNIMIKKFIDYCGIDRIQRVCTNKYLYKLFDINTNLASNDENTLTYFKLMDILLDYKIDMKYVDRYNCKFSDLYEHKFQEYSNLEEKYDYYYMRYEDLDELRILKIMYFMKYNHYDFIVKILMNYIKYELETRIHTNSIICKKHCENNCQKLCYMSSYSLDWRSFSSQNGIKSIVSILDNFKILTDLNDLYPLVEKLQNNKLMQQFKDYKHDMYYTVIYETTRTLPKDITKLIVEYI